MLNGCSLNRKCTLKKGKRLQLNHAVTHTQYLLCTLWCNIRLPCSISCMALCMKQNVIILSVCEAASGFIYIHTFIYVLYLLHSVQGGRKPVNIFNYQQTKRCNTPWTGTKRKGLHDQGEHVNSTKKDFSQIGTHDLLIVRQQC